MTTVAGQLDTQVMDYSMTRAVIDKGNLLSEEDFAFVAGSIGHIQENWERRQIYRTETEMRVSVLNDFKFPTQASKYWQCIREQSAFYEQLVQASFEYRRNTVEIKKLELAISIEKDPLELELKNIELEQLHYSRVHMSNTAQDRVRELRLWEKLLHECTEKDPSFNTSDVNEHQLLSYLGRWHNQLLGMQKGDITAGEVNNLIGQYTSGLKEAAERGMVLPLEIQADAKSLNAPVYSPEPLLRSATFEIPVST
jgi:hypothetical protein